MEMTGAPAEICHEVFGLGSDTVESAVPLECFSVYCCLLKADVESSSPLIYTSIPECNSRHSGLKKKIP